MRIHKIFNNKYAILLVGLSLNTLTHCSAGDKTQYELLSSDSSVKVPTFCGLCSRNTSILFATIFGIVTFVGGIMSNGQFSSFVYPLTTSGQWDYALWCENWSDWHRTSVPFVNTSSIDILGNCAGTQAGVIILFVVTLLMILSSFAKQFFKAISIPPFVIYVLQTLCMLYILLDFIFKILWFTSSDGGDISLKTEQFGEFSYLDTDNNILNIFATATEKISLETGGSMLDFFAGNTCRMAFWSHLADFLQQDVNYTSLLTPNCTEALIVEGDMSSCPQPNMNGVLPKDNNVTIDTSNLPSGDSLVSNIISGGTMIPFILQMVGTVITVISSLWFFIMDMFFLNTIVLK